jgi:hypothetical protein
MGAYVMYKINEGKLLKAAWKLDEGCAMDCTLYNQEDLPTLVAAIKILGDLVREQYNNCLCDAARPGDPGERCETCKKTKEFLTWMEQK